ncbi:hypothetical protein M7I_1123 [Glarea lozoyensis 74030]|uniref:Uncharacterized protein n=1 Tax=Glarea lozoyensis (strain ATCC 74030 / MF5533) TaxID=1104152 RepID=H0EF84_GLAL7|nr:hypothetical protein M7I_1123 [Glarea lozoyensis 74030]
MSALETAAPRETEGVGSDVPAGPEPEEIREGDGGVGGWRGEDGVDGGIGVIDRGAVLGGEFCEVVLVYQISEGEKGGGEEGEVLCKARRSRAKLLGRMDCGPAQVYTKPHASLHDEDLSGLQEQSPEFGLDI